VDRPPGLSVRLKLTLSYAGFLMLAGALLLAVVWVFLLRYVPDRAVVLGPGPFGPTRSDLLRAFAPKAGIALAFLLVFGLAGGWLLAGSEGVRRTVCGAGVTLVMVSRGICLRSGS
jgi:two-component system, OmpR family, sensor histidine kinase VanS